VVLHHEAISIEKSKQNMLVYFEAILRTAAQYLNTNIGI